MRSKEEYRPVREGDGKKADDTVPGLSVIVATYNRSQLLLRTLESLVRQTLPQALWEAVIVNNNSTDDTQQVFSRFLASNPAVSNIRMVTEPRQGLSHARNRGIAESRGAVVAIIDDDELVNETFAADYLSFFETHPDAAAAGGKITPLYKCPKPAWISRYTEIPVAGTLDLGREVKLFPGGKNPFGGDMALRRAALHEAGLFDPAYGRSGKALLAGEEKELFQRIRAVGGKIYWVPGPQIFHIIDGDRLTRDYFVRLNYMGGLSERTRTLARSRWAWLGKIAGEAVKWTASLLMAAGFTLKGQGQKARYLLLMRRSITRGLLGIKPPKGVR